MASFRKSSAGSTPDPNAPWSKSAISEYPKGGRQGTAIRTDRYRYVEWRDKSGKLVDRELYDHQTDPEENQNIAGKWHVQVPFPAFKEPRRGWSARPATNTYYSRKAITANNFYDLDADIGETTNLAAERPEKVKELKTLLDRWLGTAVPPGDAGAAKSAQPRRKRNP